MGDGERPEEGEVLSEAKLRAAVQKLMDADPDLEDDDPQVRAKAWHHLHILLIDIDAGAQDRFLHAVLATKLGATELGKVLGLSKQRAHQLVQRSKAAEVERRAKAQREAYRQMKAAQAAEEAG